MKIFIFLLSFLLIGCAIHQPPNSYRVFEKVELEKYQLLYGTNGVDTLAFLKPRDFNCSTKFILLNENMESISQLIQKSDTVFFTKRISAVNKNIKINSGPGTPNTTQLHYSGFDSLPYLLSSCP